ncbi:MAG: hypothetical protein MK236_10155, partial [Pedosphaera sp.]|nr:hypothetical protein [Pedosphaera sp.]
KPPSSNMARAPSTAVASPRSAWLSGAPNLPAAKYDKFSAIEWKPRRWQWVDPLKDTQADVIAADNQLAESKGVELNPDRAI